MGARQSKRSVDITTTPKKDGLPVEGVVGDAAAPGDGKLEKIEETDAKPTTNGVAPHTDATTDDKDKDKDEATEKENEKEDETKAEDAKVESPTTENPAEGTAEVTTPTEGTPASPTTATSPDSKETKKKDKLKKKWSFRSISFGKKDKSKPAREDAPKNGDVTKEEPLAEGGEEAEIAETAAATAGSAVASSPTDDKSALSSPTEKEQSDVMILTTTETVETDDSKTTIIATTVVASSPVEEKKDDNTTTPAPTPVPIEANKFEDNEKHVEPAKADKKVEVSQVMTVIDDDDDDTPVEVNSLEKKIADNNAITSSSIIERKTIEDIPSQFPSSPPPTPIDPSPLQKAQQVAANATALAEALKLPAEAANKANISYASGQNIPGNTTTFPLSNCQNHHESSNAKIAHVNENIDNTNVVAKVFTHEQQTCKIAVASPQSSVVSSSDKNDDLLVSSSSVITVTEIIQEPTLIVDSNAKTPDDKHVTEIKRETISSTTIIETVKPRDIDLVINTEEGPMPISSDNIVDATSDPVLSVSPAKVEKIVEILLKPDVEHENSEFTMKIVESSDGLLESLNDENIVIVGSPETIETLSETIVSLVNTETLNDEINEKDVPPPLPDSPIPLPKLTNQLLNFMTTQIEDPLVIPEIHENTKNNVILSQDDASCPLSLENRESTESCEIIEKIVETNGINSQTDDHNDESTSQHENVTVTRVESISQAIEDDTVTSPQQIRENPEESACCQISLDDMVCSMKSPTDSSIADNSRLIPVVSAPEIPTESTMLLLTPPRSPSSSSSSDSNKLQEANIVVTTTIESTSLIELNDEPSNREFKMESLEQSLNSYNDSEIELKDRLAESMEDCENVNCQLTNDNNLENDQSKTEPEAPVVENNIVPNDISTTEVNDEAPKSAPPAVPAEAPAPILGPVITEDVASVTKAIEEIDINEKAVAAAVNENIDSIINTNEIIADMNHQNNMNE